LDIYPPSIWKGAKRHRVRHRVRNGKNVGPGKSRMPSRSIFGGTWNNGGNTVIR